MIGKTNVRPNVCTYASTDVRMGKILCRARQMQRVSENHLVFGLSFACFMLGGGLVGSVSMAADGMPLVGGNIVVGGYGTVMLHSGASMYMLVALLAFVAGVAITTLCVRGQHKKPIK